jgi:hypothetical protein
LRFGYLGATATVLDVKKLSWGYVDLDAAVVSEPLWYNDQSGKVRSFRRSYLGVDIRLVPTFDANRRNRPDGK